MTWEPREQILGESVHASVRARGLMPVHARVLGWLARARTALPPPGRVANHVRDSPRRNSEHNAWCAECEMPTAALSRSSGGSFFTTTPSHLQLGDVTYDGQDSECR
jgi:hypothetical protein